jgi:hypothetical protein
MFKSKTINRSINKLESTNEIFGKYNVNNNDISTKVAKKITFYENLKKL